MPPPNLEDLQNLSPSAFEQLVKEVFDGLGYRATVTGRSGDEGVDLVLEKGNERSITQCKRYKGQVGQSVIREFYGTVVHEKADRGYVVTTGTFSLPAQAWAQGKNLVLVDGVDLVNSISGLGVSVPTTPSVGLEAGEVSSLAQALRDAISGNALLRLLILGPPPTSTGYVAVARAFENVLVVDLSKRLPDVSNPNWQGPRAHGGFLWFEDNIDADRETLRRFTSEVIERQSYNTKAPREAIKWQIDSHHEWVVKRKQIGLSREGRKAILESEWREGDAKRVQSMPVKTCHMICTAWEPQKVVRFLRLRQRLKFNEFFPLQLQSDVIHWSDVEGWVRKLVEGD